MEIWKDVKGYEGIYEISSIGRVKSKARLMQKYGKPFFRKDIILKAGITSAGYPSVNLWKNKKRYPISVHKLVAIAFLNHKPKEDGLVVNHINFIKTDNRVENLEIVTYRENNNLKHYPSSSKYTGVTWEKRSKKWLSQIVYKGKTIKLGRFQDEKEASLYYENAVKATLKGVEIKDLVRKKSSHTSQHKYVFFVKQCQKWHVRIKNKHIGTFKTEEEAANTAANLPHF